MHSARASSQPRALLRQAVAVGAHHRLVRVRGAEERALQAPHTAMCHRGRMAGCVRPPVDWVSIYHTNTQANKQNNIEGREGVECTWPTRTESSGMRPVSMGWYCGPSVKVTWM
eukprot:1261582-Rhodomonas_salina.1